MTLQEAYEYGQKQLQQAGIEEFAIDAWYLLEYVTGISRGTYFLDQNRTISDVQEQAYVDAIGKRVNRIPLQHITGVQEFMGFTFAVNEHVLVPRQDTEVLVESVLKALQKGDKILDMCTGSGCILISLIKHARETVSGVGVDISNDALQVAEENAKTLGVEVTFLQSDLFEKVEGKYQIIVSNPPYIPTSVIEDLQEEVKLYDPRLALDGKEDGLYFYREIVQESPKYLQAGGSLYFEIGHDQGEAVSSLMREAGFQNIAIKKDLAGLDRVVFGVYNQ